MRIPESMAIIAVPVLLALAFDVAVMVITKFGYFVASGNTVGAVKVAVEATVVLLLSMLERTPTAPFAVVHAAAAEGLGLGTAVVALGVVVNVQAKSAARFVEPVTTAVNVTDCVTTSVPDPGVTVTTT